MFLVRLEFFFALILLLVSASSFAQDVCQNADMQATYNVLRAKYSLAASNQTNEDLLVSKFQKQDQTDKGKAGTSSGSRFADPNGSLYNIWVWYNEKKSINALIPKWQQADTASVTQFEQSAHPITTSDPNQFANSVSDLTEAADSTNAEIAQRLQQNLHTPQVPNQNNANSPLNFGAGAWITDELNLSAAKATSAVYAKEAATFKDAVNNIVMSSACHQTETESSTSQQNTASRTNAPARAR